MESLQDGINTIEGLRRLLSSVVLLHERRGFHMTVNSLCELMVDITESYDRLRREHTELMAHNDDI